MHEDKRKMSSGSGSGDSERLLSDDEYFPRERATYAKARSWIGTAALVAATACIAGSIGAWIGSSNWRRDPTEVSCTKQLNQYYRSVAIPADKAEKAGIAKDQVKISEKYGGGYPANVEGLHHLHCLNLLRQSLYYNYDHYHSAGKGAFSNADHIVRKHLMCTVDTGVLGQVWFKPSDAPLEAFVDFNTRHKCRDFDAVRDWAAARQIPAAVPRDFLQPPAPGDTVYTSIP
ncbi:hypothetical protein SLS58_008546 [Diplodia intermedia]|uniref:Tat pathway signal sequence n=1 Tax=Diplodia intermedia TaxID=856260 RepID=A0ABR3TH42_9PEZI